MAGNAVVTSLCDPGNGDGMDGIERKEDFQQFPLLKLVGHLNADGTITFSLASME